ncbi:MAG: glycoside hydrolase family 127 protein [Firmicutes bacterium]|nr:glycoside hydrolase family 127 protein [Bacillota bacterium]
MSVVKNNTLKIEPVPFKNVKITKGFWFEKFKLVKEEVLPYQWKTLNDEVPGAEPSHAIENFKIAAGESDSKFQGRVFQDSDVAKWLEAVSYCLAVEPDSELEKLADEVIALIGRAQQEDGYLNTYYTVAQPDKRWTDLRIGHELYCAGHMIEAGVAYYLATGKRNLLDIVIKFADYIDSVFGPEEGKKRGYPGHQEIELALVKLYQVTGNERYLNLSKFFIDERGKQPHYFDLEAEARGAKPRKRRHDYSQSHVPIREQEVAIGHAVRAMYFYSGAADVARLTGDQELANVCRRLWENVTNRQMYITGSIGSTVTGEAFSFDYDLPNDVAYAETCAAVGVILWAHRMLKLEVNSKYADVMERVLYNGMLSGMSLDGKRYFYINPLEVWPEANKKRPSKKFVSPVRQQWFTTACCPPNMARLIASLNNYIYSQTDGSTSEDSVYVHLYIDSKAEVEFENQKITINQETNYPWEDTVVFTIDADKAVDFTLNLRMPGWCRNPQVIVNDEEVITQGNAQGYFEIKRTWQPGDKVYLSLPMVIELIEANPQVRVNAGKVAIQRGPLVYCLEEVDNGPVLQDIVLPKEPELVAEFDPDLLGGVTVIKGKAYRSVSFDENNVLYKPIDYRKKEVDIVAIPYFSWVNRTPGEMIVWVRIEK